MDTNLGQITLSFTQIQNSSLIVRPTPFVGFSFSANGIVGVSEMEPTDQQKTDAVAWLQALPMTPCKQLLIDQFNSETAIGREAQVFSGSDLMRLAPVSYTINTLITYKNFWGGVANDVPYAGLQQLGHGLVSAGAITQADYDKLNGILKEQGIDLDNPPAA